MLACLYEVLIKNYDITDTLSWDANMRKKLGSSKERDISYVWFKMKIFKE